MALLSDYAARVALQQCIVQQGGKCYICNDLKYPQILEHKDNNRSNNPEDGSNWAAACISCNVKKGKEAKVSAKRNKKHSAREKSVCVSVCGMDDGGLSEELITSREIQISEIYRPKFRKWVKFIVESEGNPTAKRIVDGGHEKFGRSQKTLALWLDGMCSPEGNYEYVKNEHGRNCVRKKEKK